MTPASIYGALLVMASAWVGAAPDTPQVKIRAGDPNEMVCEKQEVVGSRLALRRVCHTRAQRADLRLQDRQEIERVQVQRGSCQGKHCM
ncbi:MAG: hypothetical protein ABI626_04900 [Sphingomicrobium sp.]